LGREKRRGLSRERGAKKVIGEEELEETSTADMMHDRVRVNERVGEWGLVKKMSVPAHDNHLFARINTYLTRNLQLFYQTPPLRRAILAA
jgi:hypothetical protein